MQYVYSPDTGELINTDTPAAWMGVTSLAPPLFDAAASGCFFRNGAWEIVISGPDLERLAADARSQRNALISASDWTQLPDSPLSTAQRTAWSAYRQALRDISLQAGFPTDIQWPVAP